MTEVATIPVSVFPELSKWQQSVWLHKDEWWMLFGGRRSTKSTVCWLKGADTSLHGGRTDWYCANTELADENWQDVVDFLAPYASRVNRYQDGIMDFQSSDYGQGQFRRRTAFNKWAGRAGTVNHLIFDEFQLLKRGLYVRALPSILTTKGRISATLTPPETPNEFYEAAWIKDILDSADEHGYSTDKRFKRWYITHHPTSPYDVAFVFMMNDRRMERCDLKTLEWYRANVRYKLPDEYSQKGHNKAWDKYLKDAIDSLDSDKEDLQEDYEREYNLLWAIDTTTLIYSNIRDGIHRNASFEYDSESPVFWTVDRGEGKGWHVLLFMNRIQSGYKKVKQGDDTVDVPIFTYRVFDEIATHDIISEGEMLQRALERSREKNYKLPGYVVYDVRAPGYRQEIRDAGLLPVARSVGIEDGIRKVRRYISKQHFQMHPRCSRMWQNLMNYCRDSAGYPEEKKDNDAADALRYGIWCCDMLSGLPNDTAMENQDLVNEIAAGEGGVLWLAF